MVGSVKRIEHDVGSSPTFSQKLKKVLDKLSQVCYNKSTKRSSKGCLHKSPIPCGFMSVPAKNQLTRFQPSIFSEKYKTWQFSWWCVGRLTHLNLSPKSERQPRKKCLTNSQKCAIIKAQRGALTIERGTSLEHKRTKPPVRMISAQSAPLNIGEYRESANSAVCKTVPFGGSGVGTHLSYQMTAQLSWQSNGLLIRGSRVRVSQRSPIFQKKHLTTGQSCAIIRPQERRADVGNDLGLGVAPEKADLINVNIDSCLKQGIGSHE